MARAGLTPYQILAAGTRNPAIYLKAESEFGTVEAGKRADLILIDDNPLKDVANVAKRSGVMLRGQWLPPEVLLQTPDSACQFPLVQRPVVAALEYALTNSFGFGGANATVILRKA